MVFITGLAFNVILTDVVQGAESSVLDNFMMCSGYLATTMHDVPCTKAVLLHQFGHSSTCYYYYYDDDDDADYYYCCYL